MAATIDTGQVTVPGTELDTLRDRLNTAGNKPGNIWFRHRDYYMKYFCPKLEWALLDFGAYVGANLLHYHELGHIIDGVEVVDTYVQAYRDRVHGMDDPPVMHHCLIEEFAPVRQYEAVICCEVLQYSPYPRTIFAKAAECLRPDGALFTSVPARECPTDYRIVTPQNLIDWYQSTGFVVDAVVFVPGSLNQPGCVSQVIAGGRLHA